MTGFPAAGAPHDGSLNLLKCLLVLGVVLQHSAFQRFSVPAQELVASLQHFFSFVVVGFFWAAGFLIKREASFAVFAGKRFSRLIVPFLVVSLINWLAFKVIAAGTGRESGYAMSVPEFLRAVLTLQGVGPQMYFLTYLFMLQLCVFGVDRLRPDGRVLAALSVFVLSLWLLCWDNTLPMGPSVRNIPLYFSALLLGMACRPPFCLAFAPASAAALILMACAWLPAGAWHSVCCWAAPGAMYFGLRQLGANLAWRDMNNDILSAFLWHTPLLLPILSILCVQGRLPGYWPLVLSVIGAVVLAAGFGRWLYKLGWGRAVGLARV